MIMYFMRPFQKSDPYFFYVYFTSFPNLTLSELIEKKGQVSLYLIQNFELHNFRLIFKWKK